MNDTQIDQSSEEELLRTAGSQLMPLFTWQGRDVYPVCGAEGDDEGGNADPDSEPDDDGDSGAGKGDSGGDSDTVSREDFAKLQKQLSAADKAREAAQKELKKIEDGKKDELTKATERAEELEKAVQERDKQLAELRLQNAFLTADTGVTWHDPADALALAERQGYLAEVVGEEGQVDAAKLKVKLKELAAAKPHLVKKSSGDEGGSGSKETPPSGKNVGSKGSSGKQGAEKLPGRYDKFLNR